MVFHIPFIIVLLIIEFLTLIVIHLIIIVYVDGKSIDKILIDNNTLSIHKDSCSVGSTIKIVQPSAIGSIFSSSNEIIFQ